MQYWNDTEYKKTIYIFLRDFIFTLLDVLYNIFNSCSYKLNRLKFDKCHGL